jgi:hypothetical protein
MDSEFAKRTAEGEPLLKGIRESPSDLVDVFDVLKEPSPFLQPEVEEWVLKSWVRAVGVSRLLGVNLGDVIKNVLLWLHRLYCSFRSNATLR